MHYRLSCPDAILHGKLILEPSKSISNRLLIIQSLCRDPFEIHHLSKSDDTRALQHMLASTDEVLHAGHAGTSLRFMLARACLLNREVKLDGSAQLRKRPIGPLVNALRQLGANIQYLIKDGYPPLLVNPAPLFGKNNHEVHLHAGISSQFVTALMLIGPVLPRGLVIHLADEIVSGAYISMTLAVMQWFGLECDWKDNTIRIPHKDYKGRDFMVEGDWSAASYYYSFAVLVKKADIEIEGLSQFSLQGDAAVRDIYQTFGVDTTFLETGIRLTKKDAFQLPKEFAFDFSDHPDLAQTVMVTMAALGIPGKLSGLKTLRIKETDRLEAMQKELSKVKVELEINEMAGDLECMIKGKAKWKDKAKFDTYHDHRMAMSLAPLSCLHPVMIRDVEVVNKSYPGFWSDLKKIGLKMEAVKK